MREIEYGRGYPGHSLSLLTGDDGVLRGHAFNSQPLRPGDRLTWTTHYGTCTGEITECHHCFDPWDMYRIAVKVIARHDTSGVVLT